MGFDLGGVSRPEFALAVHVPIGQYHGWVGLASVMTWSETNFTVGINVGAVPLPEFTLAVDVPVGQHQGQACLLHLS